MKSSSFGYRTLAVGTALTLALVGCGGANEAATKTEEKAEEKTEQVEQAEQQDEAISWTDAASAEEAAKGAGFATFGVPASFTLGDVTFENPTFAYADGVAQATYEQPATMIVIRKADGEHSAPMTDRELVEFANKSTVSLADLDVALYGAQRDTATVLTWTDGTKEFGVTFQGLGGEEMAFTVEESEYIVRTIKEADAATAAAASAETPAEATAEDAATSTDATDASTEAAATSNDTDQSGTDAAAQPAADSTAEASAATTTESADGETTEYAAHDWEEEVMADQDDTAGMNAQFSKDQCTYNALSSVGAGDMAANVNTSDLIMGGGTLYYLVEFDLTGTHYRVMVDAIDGGIIDVTESIDGEVINY